MPSAKRSGRRPPPPPSPNLQDVSTCTTWRGMQFRLHCHTHNTLITKKVAPNLFMLVVSSWARVLFSPPFSRVPWLSPNYPAVSEMATYPVVLLCIFHVYNIMHICITYCTLYLMHIDSYLYNHHVRPLHSNTRITRMHAYVNIVSGTGINM